MMAKGVIEVENLVKTFKGNIKAVQGVSFEVGDGEFFAFLGPNGAGKSTTIQMLTTLIRPTSGRATISGYDVDLQPEVIRREIGVALQETGVDPSMTGRELLELQARLFGMTGKDARARAIDLLELINLTEAADRKVGKYSGGMRRRLDLSLCLVHRPKVLFLDEPTTGLDPLNRKAIWEEIRRLNQDEGTTIFLTTQYLEEADQLAKRIAIIDQGKIVQLGTSVELKQSIGMDVIELQFSDEASTTKAMQFLKAFSTDIQGMGTQVTVYVEQGSQKLPDMVRTLDQEGLPPLSLNLSPPTLDDVFLKVTGRHIEGTTAVEEAERP